MAIDRTQFNLLVDDAGDGTSGTVVDKNKIKVVILDPIDALITNPAAFTPTIISSGGGVPTYGLQVARYQLINGFLCVGGQVQLATFGTLAAGTITIGGLPTAAVNIANLSTAATIGYWALTSAAAAVTGLIDPAASAIRLIISTSLSAPANLTKADLSATSAFNFSAFYPVA